MQYKDLNEFQENLHFIFNNLTGDETSPVHHYIDIACNVLNVMEHTYKGRFMQEYCARSIHDAHIGGLADHTAKVFTELVSMLYAGDADERYYGTLLEHVDTPSLIVGCILHDVGKIQEYDNGKNGDYHYVSHNMLGIELITFYKSFIVDKLGVEEYYRILSIIGQHHGDFGEKPQTIEAYLIHLADYQETKLQILNEALANTVRGLNLDTTGNFFVESEYLPYRLSVHNLDLPF